MLKLKYHNAKKILLLIFAIQIIDYPQLKIIVWYYIYIYIYINIYVLNNLFCLKVKRIMYELECLKFGEI